MHEIYARTVAHTLKSADHISFMADKFTQAASSMMGKEGMILFNRFLENTWMRVQSGDLTKELWTKELWTMEL